MTLKFYTLSREARLVTPRRVFVMGNAEAMAEAVNRLQTSANAVWLSLTT
jgi:hypothetical protein